MPSPAFDDMPDDERLALAIERLALILTSIAEGLLDRSDASV